MWTKPVKTVGQSVEHSAPATEQKWSRGKYCLRYQGTGWNVSDVVESSQLWAFGLFRSGGNFSPALVSFGRSFGHERIVGLGQNEAFILIPLGSHANVEGRRLRFVSGHVLSFPVASSRAWRGRLRTDGLGTHFRFLKILIKSSKSHKFAATWLCSVTPRAV